MSPRNWKFRLEDIVDSLESIFDYVKDLDAASWDTDRKTIDAVIRNIEIIGEAAAHIPEDVREGHPDIPWHQMIGMRNVLIHEYFGVDTDVLWQTIQNDLPILYNEIKKII